MDCELKELFGPLNKKLNSGLLSGRVLLDRMRLLDETSRKSAAYADHRYVPFYYYLGELIQPESMIEVGFYLGLLSAAFLRSCKTVERYLAFQEPREQYYSPRIGKANVRDVYRGPFDIYIGEVHDDEFTVKISPNSWDLIILNDETGYDKHLLYLDFVWPYLSENGLIVSEYITRHEPAKEAFFAFCAGKNREPLVFDTRYGTGIVQK